MPLFRAVHEDPSDALRPADSSPILASNENPGDREPALKNRKVRSHPEYLREPDPKKVEGTEQPRETCGIYPEVSGGRAKVLRRCVILPGHLRPISRDLRSPC